MRGVVTQCTCSQEGTSEILAWKVRDK